MSSLSCHPPLHVASDTTPMPRYLNPIATSEISRDHPPPALAALLAITNYQSSIAFGSALVFGIITPDECALIANA